MTDKILRCICALIILSLSTAEVIPQSARNGRRRNVADPVSNFFSELGDLFLDIDRSLTVQTAPKVASGDNIVNQMFRPSTDYFSKVQENYKEFQNRLGNMVRDTIGPKIVYTDRDLTTVGPLVLNEESFSSEASNETPERVKKLSEGSNVDRRKLRQPLQKKADFEADNECTEGTEESLTNSGKREQCSKLEIDRRKQVRESIARKIEEIKRINELLSTDAEEILRPSQIFSKRDGKVTESGPNPDGRLLGDILYSESSFDKYIRQLLRDHGKWVLDNPLLSRWRMSGSDAKDKKERTLTQKNEIPITAVDDSTDVDSGEKSTQATTAESETEPSNLEFSTRELPVRSRNYYTVVDDGGVIEEEIDIVLSPLSDSKIKDAFKTTNRLKERSENRETVILAFTPSGVPLKLRMGPEIKNPVRFLNGVLKSAGVSLNVPVESYDDIEPVGKEVMKYGAGVLTRAVYLDLSKEDELKTLLKTLMKSKPSKV